MSVAGDWLGLWERKNQRAFRPSAWGIQVYRDWTSTVKMRCWGARELDVLEEVDGAGGVPDIGGAFLEERGRNRVKVSGDKFSGAGAGRDIGSAGAVRFVDSGKEIETDGAGLGNDEVEG
eukprot:g16769.t1